MSGMGRSRLPIGNHVGPGIPDVLVAQAVAQAEVQAKVEGPNLTGMSFQFIQGSLYGPGPAPPDLAIETYKQSEFWLGARLASHQFGMSGSFNVQVNVLTGGSSVNGWDGIGTWDGSKKVMIDLYQVMPSFRGDGRLAQPNDYPGYQRAMTGVIMNDGFDLRLMSWGDGSGVPTSGNNLVIVGIDNNRLLHIRIYDDAGNRITDTDETKLPVAKAAAIATLKQRLPGLLALPVLTDDENAQVIGEAISIVGQTVKDTAGFSGKWYGGNLVLQGTWAPSMLIPEIGPKIMARIQVPTLSPPFPILSPPSPVVGGGA